jgi:2-polyprenyl-3-methyl-5-hydroxy-6-metoxy-1,4-benzoquinol methylase
VLGFGAADGREVEAILARAKQVTILEPSDGFSNERFTYVKPQPSGIMPFADNSFDLITCLGVLHHIPNVSTILSEFARVLRPGGLCLAREPIISMGDWRVARKGLTRHERGIPMGWFKAACGRNKLEIVSEAKCMFSIISLAQKHVRWSLYDSPFVVVMDALLCGLPIWPKAYHPRSSLHKFRPQSCFFVLRKPIEAGSFPP